MNAFRPTHPSGEPVTLGNVESLRGFGYFNLSCLTPTQLDLRHRESCRWLDLPGSHLWPDEKAKREAEVMACAAEMRRRMAEGKAIAL